MNLPDTDLITICNFIEGRLSPAEEKMVRQKMEEDKDFNLEVETYAQLSADMRQEKLDAKLKAIGEKLPPIRESDLLSLEEAVEEEMDQSQKSLPLPTPWWISMLRNFWLKPALLLVVVGIGIYWMSNQYSNQHLAQEYVLLPATPDPAGAGAEVLLFEGYQLFEDGKFEASLEKFAAIPAENAYYAQARLFWAYAQFKIGEYGEAQSVFEEMIRTNNYPGLTDLDTLQWNSLMCDLAMNRNQWEAELDEAPPEFSGQSTQLRADLRSFWRKIAEIFQ